MSQAVELSDAFVSEARSSADLSKRSLADQIEFWAELGRAIESTMRVDEVEAQKRIAPTRLLSECLREVDTPAGRARLKEILRHSPFPHYEPVPDRPEYLIRIDADGTRAVGRFVDRRFVIET